MKKDTIPTFVLEYRDNIHPNRWHRIVWNSKKYGRPTDVNAEQWRVKMNESYKYSGINYHVSLHYGILVHVSHVRIVRQRTGEIIASATMPTFEII